jgi:oxygen-dependent protoporphyrinogen oxidase
MSAYQHGVWPELCAIQTVLMPASQSSRKIAVIGGGIAGLAAAHRLLEPDPTIELTLFEASDRLGGSLWTERRDGFLVERGADSFITNVPWGIDLCRRLGLADDLIGTNPRGRQAFVVRRGRLVPIPEGFMLMAPSQFWPLVTTPLLSPLGKLRLACEYFIPRRNGGEDESLASFARRRLGREAFERLVQPLAAGIYTADPEKLSLAATLPRFQVMEREHGGLIRAARKKAPALEVASANGPSSGARYGLFVTPRGGLSTITSAIAARLRSTAVRLRTPVSSLMRCDDCWRINIDAPPSRAGDRPPRRSSDLDFDAVVVAVAAPITARLLEGVHPGLVAELAAIEYAGAVVVSMAFDRQQIRHRLDGFGFVVPAIERRRILSASFSSEKFSGRAPEGKVLIRTFVGGACQRELVDLNDADLERFVSEELAQLLGISGQPLWTTIARWSQSMPQYHLGHLDRVGRIESLVSTIPGLELAGNAYRGVGIPHAIHSGEQAAERLLASGSRDLQNVIDDNHV